MTRMKLLGLVGLVCSGAALLAVPAGANPPYPNSTYHLYANNAEVGQLYMGPLADQQVGATLGPGSWVMVDCLAGTTRLFTVRIDLGGTPINNPAGVINAFPPLDKMTKLNNPTNVGGTLSGVRFFLRFFPRVGGAPTSSPPPQGAPQAGTTFSLPSPGAIGTGNVSGRNNTATPGGPGFCSFSLNLFADNFFPS
jgi:hypothetical protein